MRIVSELMPDLTEIEYDTAAATVLIHHTGEDSAISRQVNVLLTVAANSAGKFLLADQERRRTMRDRLAATLEEDPVDLAEPGAADHIQRIIDRL
jgi:hypothetical protein